VQVPKCNKFNVKIDIYTLRALSRHETFRFPQRIILDRNRSFCGLNRRHRNSPDKTDCLTSLYLQYDKIRNLTVLRVKYTTFWSSCPYIIMWLAEFTLKNNQWSGDYNKIITPRHVGLITMVNPLTAYDLYRCHAVSPLKIKIPSKNMRENQQIH
jgi:hypothetical protein